MALSIEEQWQDVGRFWLQRGQYDIIKHAMQRATLIDMMMRDGRRDDARAALLDLLSEISQGHANLLREIYGP